MTDISCNEDSSVFEYEDSSVFEYEDSSVSEDSKSWETMSSSSSSSSTNRISDKKVRWHLHKT